MTTSRLLVGREGDKNAAKHRLRHALQPLVDRVIELLELAPITAGDRGRILVAEPLHGAHELVVERFPNDHMERAKHLESAPARVIVDLHIRTVHRYVRLANGDVGATYYVKLFQIFIVA
jgi:hypothetical protein